MFDACPICAPLSGDLQRFDYARNDEQDSWLVDCARCGGFEITYELATSAEFGGMSADERAALSHAIRIASDDMPGSRVLLTTMNWRSLLGPLVSAWSGSQFLFAVLGALRRRRSAGEWTEPEHIEAWVARAGLCTRSQMFHVLDTLQGRGWAAYVKFGQQADSIFKLVISVEGLLALEQYAPSARGKRKTEDQNMGIKIFISHAAADVALVSEFVDYLERGLLVPSGAIRCTSLDGYKLRTGDRSDAVLRQDILDSTVVIGVLTRSSLQSTWVLFELGAGWALQKWVAPVLSPDLSFSRDLPGPLQSAHAILSNDGGALTQLLDDISRETGIEVRKGAGVRRAVDRLTAFADEYAGGVGLSRDQVGGLSPQQVDALALWKQSYPDASDEQLEAVQKGLVLTGAQSIPDLLEKATKMGLAMPGIFKK